VRDETTPEDFRGIVAARAVLTARGGMTSHAAVVARGMGKCAVVGCKDIEVDLEHRSFSVNGTHIAEGDWLTLDGATGRVFAEGDRITAMREMIVAREEGGRRRALNKLLPMQRADFEGIFEAMDGLPVTIRLLDPPLHEFLPHGGEETKLLARTLDMARADLNRIIDSLRETNPMLGHRGCRLGISYPEITEMQGRAILEAAVRAMRRGIVV